MKNIFPKQRLIYIAKIIKEIRDEENGNLLEPEQMDEINSFILKPTYRKFKVGKEYILSWRAGNYKHIKLTNWFKCVLINDKYIVFTEVSHEFNSNSFKK